MKFARAVLGGDGLDLEPASSDASFRRYWRVSHAGGTLILMDAPPGQEDCGRYADLARRFRAIGINTPEIFGEDLEQGFLAISDLGDRLYLSELDASNVERLYADAFAALAVIQARGPLDGLPTYDGPFLRRELGIFEEWFLDRLLGIPLDGAGRAAWTACCDLLVESALEQPSRCVHRDFHSRNLMVTDPPSPGVLDFQDAVVGPVTYDLVSLLRDCYIAWEPGRVEDWALGYLDLASRSGVVADLAPGRFLRWFDLMGVQRHLKACGIFARLNLRDDKPQYLGDIPRTLGYVRAVAERYPQLDGLSRLIRERVDPALSRLGIAPAAQRTEVR